MIAPFSWTRKPITPQTSNGTTAVSLVAGVSAKVTIPVKLTLRNSDTVAHTVTLLSGTTTIYVTEVPAASALLLDNDEGYVRTDGGDDLKFKIDSGGVGTTVTVSGLALQ